MIIKRFLNTKLRNILKLCRENRNKSLTVEDSKLYEQIQHNVKQSIEKLISRQIENKDKKSYKKYNDKFDELDKKLENKEITQQQYEKGIDKVEYKYNKTQYELNNLEEKPKNPTFENLKNGFLRGVNATRHFFENMGKNIGKMFKKTPLLLKEAGKQSFKAGYKGTKKLIKGTKMIGNGVKFVGNKVSELTKDIREEADLEMEQSILKKAAKQQVEAIENNNPRKKLGMQHFEINHQEAIEKSNQEVSEEKKSQQLENE